MLNKEMSGAEITEFIRELLMENYNLGEVLSVEAIKVGDTNNSYFAFAEKDEVVTKWYVRQYNQAEQKTDLIYEHAFEKYYTDNVNGEMETMLPVPTKSGQTWVEEEYGGKTNFYAVFNVIYGLETYHWEYNELSDKAIDECGAMLAKFHAWSYGFEAPEGGERSEEPLEGQFKTWKRELPGALAEKKKEDRLYFLFNRLMDKEASYFLEMTDFVESEMEKNKKDLVKCVCHKDMNPGNLMFDEDDNVVAVFDLDWVNEEYRLYDIAWTAYLALASWDVDSWGIVDMDKVNRMVRSYNKTITEKNCPLGPLNETEEKMLPVMLMISAMKVIIDNILYEDHSEEPHRMFTTVWRFMESIRSLRNGIKD